MGHLIHHKNQDIPATHLEVETSIARNKLSNTKKIVKDDCDPMGGTGRTSPLGRGFLCRALATCHGKSNVAILAEAVWGLMLPQPFN